MNLLRVKEDPLSYCRLSSIDMSHEPYISGSDESFLSSHSLLLKAYKPVTFPKTPSFPSGIDGVLGMYLGHIKGISMKCQISLDKFGPICFTLRPEGKKMGYFNLYFFYFYFDAGHP